MNVLFVVPYAPTCIRTRSVNAIRALASNGHEVTVAALWNGEEEYGAVDALRTQVSTVIERRLRPWRSTWNCLRALPGHEPLQAHYCWDPEFARDLVEAVRTTPFDIVHVEHLRGVRYASAIRDATARRSVQSIPVVWDSVDCITALFRHAARDGASIQTRLTARLEAPRTADYEGHCVSQFRRVMVVAERDRRQLAELADAWCRRHRVPCWPHDRIAVVPNAVDVDYFSPTSVPRDPLTLVITGKMSYHANVTAVVRFVEDVMPLIWAQLPEVRLWIVGKDPAPQIRKLGVHVSEPWAQPFSSNGSRRSRVQITGTVPDIRPFLRRATVAVAPIRYGAGIQNKVLEAFACGTPVVATPEAVTALGARHGTEMLVGASPRELADGVVGLMRDPTRRAGLGEAARAFVLREHGRQALARSLAGVYREARG